jgi:hypothetical protein
MKTNILILLIVLVLFNITTNAQTKVTSYDDLTKQVQEIVISTDTISENVLVTGKGFNMFVQKKVSTYLTGSSEISLSKLYATYASESDKLTFGFNAIKTNKETGRLVSLFNPMLEANIKNNFATLYKKEQWQSDIRLGFKYTYLLPFSTINFLGMHEPKDQKSKMIKKRNVATQSIIDRITKEKTAFSLAGNATLTQSQQLLKAPLEKDLSILQSKSAQTPEDTAQIAKIKVKLSDINALTAKDSVKYDKKLEEYESEIAKAEVEALYEKDSYTWSQTSWISLWGFYPLTEKKNYIAENNTQIFSKQKFNPWELNAQFNYLREGHLGSFFFTTGYKVFQNNSALADLMTSADYNQYLQFPGIDTLNAVILETNKAFIGKYKEFVTSNINVQVVLSLSDKKKDGGEKFITAGISIRFEKNIGDFSATNWRFGLPLRFKGKDKAINIEPQLRLNNTNNYSNKSNYKVQPIFGINVGLPFTALFK